MNSAPRARPRNASLGGRGAPWVALFSSLCLLPSLPPALAAELRDLYEVRFPVADETKAARASSLRAAMRIVLLRLTGNRQAVAAGPLQEFLREVDRYVLRYRYKTAPPAKADQPDALQLIVLFNQPALDQRLRELGITIWGQQRPAVLVWLAVSDDAGPRLLGVEEHSRYLRALNRQARTRGIALVYPLLDIEDNERISISDIRGGFVEPILQASARYGADAILCGMLEKLGGELWQVRWSMVGEERATTWSNEGGLAATLLEEGINTLVDDLTARYLSPEMAEQEEQLLTLTVRNVRDLTQYAAVLAHLRVLNSVVNVRVTRLDGDRVSFALRSVGNEDGVRQAIALGRKLKAVDGSDGLEYTLREARRAQ